MTHPTTLTDHPFSPDQAQAMAVIVAMIIPASPDLDLPGADDPVILADILHSGAKVHSDLAVALAGLGPDDRGLDIDGASFRTAQPAAARLIQTLAVQCYYRDPRVLTALKIEPRPPFPIGFKLGPNDLSLLDPVRQRGAVFRQIPQTHTTQKD